MKLGILIYQIIQEKFAYGELFMLVMIGYIFMFKMVKKMQNSGLEMVAGLTCPLMWSFQHSWQPTKIGPCTFKQIKDVWKQECAFIILHCCNKITMYF